MIDNPDVDAFEWDVARFLSTALEKWLVPSLPVGAGMSIDLLPRSLLREAYFSNMKYVHSTYVRNFIPSIRMC